MGIFLDMKFADSEFQLIDEVINNDVAWLKYLTAIYDVPGTFKLEKVDGKWLVSARHPRVEVPF
ncbi:hypothetical protein [Winogradskyella vidalii]|uniref:hypothetical protein n=1 Tax=Winogradskyella vidalii TaxID=2615024 RepID=UPI0015C9E8C2|nr:hypothetical protein [Winogradskyella vidalii]